MNTTSKTSLRFHILTAGVLVLALASLAWAVPAAAQSRVHLRGTIHALTPASVTIKTLQGAEKVVAVNAKTHVTGVAPADPGQIHAGSYVGIANMDSGQGNMASEVVVFPASMKGAGLGDYPWDVSRSLRRASQGSATAGASHMTNGTVTSGVGNAGTAAQGSTRGRSMMTNGTVARVATSGRMTLSVDYGQGTKQIVVAPGTPVVRIAHADRNDLKVGAPVFVTATPEPGASTLVARMIVVGLEGAAPPM